MFHVYSNVVQLNADLWSADYVLLTVLDAGEQDQSLNAYPLGVTVQMEDSH